MESCEDGNQHQPRNYTSYTLLSPELEIAVPPNSPISLKSPISSKTLVTPKTPTPISPKSPETPIPPKATTFISPKPPISPTSSRYIEYQCIDKPLPPIPPPPPKSAKRHLAQREDPYSNIITSTQTVASFSSAKYKLEQRGSRKRIENLTGHILNVDTWQPMIEETTGNSSKLFDQDPVRPLETTVLPNSSHVVTFLDTPQIIRSSSSSSGSLPIQDDILEDIIDSYNLWGLWAPNPESPNSNAKRSLHYSASESNLGFSGRTVDARRHSRASLDGAQELQNARMNFADLIAQEGEREHTGGYTVARDIGRSYRGNTSPSDNLERESFGYRPWNENDTFRRVLTPEPLVLRPRNLREPRPSMSRFSDYSSEDNRGIIPNTRDSVISHIRALSSPFKPPSGLAMVFKENASYSTIQPPLPEPVKRKGGFSSGKHPLKSPFPLRSSIHKRVHLEESPNSDESSFKRRISNVYKKISRTQVSPAIESRAISNHARSGDGPDTPIPTRSRFIGVISPTQIFHKSTLQFQDAMRKAKRAAGVKSRDEKWRDKMRSQIVVLGMAEPSPSRPDTPWL